MDSIPLFISQVVMGVGLAASAGLRAFLPLLLVGLAGRFDVLPLSESFAWMAGNPALNVFAVAVVVEVLADKVPVVDNVLDSVQVFVKPVAGAVLVASVVTDLTPLQSAVLAIVTGGATAGGVQLAKAKTRFVSTLSTAGLANPVLSVGEDVGAAAGSVASILLWPLAILVMLGAFAMAALVLSRRRRRPVVPDRPGGA